MCVHAFFYLAQQIFKQYLDLLQDHLKVFTRSLRLMSQILPYEQTSTLELESDSNSLNTLSTFLIETIIFTIQTKLFSFLFLLTI